MIKITIAVPTGEVYDTIFLLRSDIEGADWKITQAFLKDVLEGALACPLQK